MNKELALKIVSCFWIIVLVMPYACGCSKKTSNDPSPKCYFCKAPKDNKNMVCEEYGDLIAAIDKWSFVNNIEFRMDLG